MTGVQKNAILCDNCGYLSESGQGAPDLDTPAWNTLFVAPGQRRRARLCAAARTPFLEVFDNELIAVLLAGIFPQVKM